MDNNANRKPLRHILSFKIKRKIAALIELHCHKLENSYALYDVPWTDELIWKECIRTIDANITINHVSAIRKEEVGSLAPAKGGVPKRSQITDLAVRLNALEDWASKRKDNPFQRPALLLNL